MSKFFETIKERVKRIPNLIAKRLVQASIFGDSLTFVLPPVMQNQTVKQYLEDLIIKVNEIVVYDATQYPFDYDVKMDEKLYLNRDILEIYDKPLKIGDKLGVIVPNRPNLTTGFHFIVIGTHSAGVKASFNKYFSLTPEKTNITTPQIAKKKKFIECEYCGKQSSDPNQVICEYCGSELKK
ncbi:MAG: hypothetical protein ACXAEX_01635 [Promethearchaeota archaeon]|jgi:hypothetical protein